LKKPVELGPSITDYSMLRHLQVTPSFFADESIIGGGERHVENFCKALLASAAERGFPIKCELVAFGARSGTIVTHDGFSLRLIQGNGLDMTTLDAGVLKAELVAADVVHVHQCLTVFGLFVATHGKLLGRRVIGTDHGGGVANDILERHPTFAAVYDVFRAQSKFAALGFADFGVPCCVMRGPVNDEIFILGDGSRRDRNLILSVGRILPHKGFENIIDSLVDGMTLVIAGRPYDPEYKNFLQSRANGRSVHFEETLDDAGLLSLMHRAGLYVHSSTHLDYKGGFHLKPELMGLAPLEFLCTGGPALVSRAGALRELGELTGCTTFTDAQALRGLLEQYASGQMETHAATAIRDDVVAKYGLRQFGRRYLELLEELSATPSRQ
jgi:glycosyltransferase involved in cell wall biosynthesis